MIYEIESWHKAARPQPTADDFRVQLGCHFEEVVEMLDTLAVTYDGFPELFGKGLAARQAMNDLANALKTGKAAVRIKDRKEFLDSVADQVVTGVGAAYCAGMKAADAVARVDESNWSKFDDDGQPIRDANGKIKKGPNYMPPDLTGLYGEQT